MKATTFRLFATMITLAAVTIAITIPANAQRRSTQSRTETKVPERSNTHKSTVEKKTTSKQYHVSSRTSHQPKPKSVRVQQKPSSTAARSSNTSARNTSSRYSDTRSSKQSSPRTIKSTYQQSRKSTKVQGPSRTQTSKDTRSKTYTSGRSINSEINRSSNRTPSKRQYASVKTSGTSNRETARRTTGTNVSNSSSFYRTDKSDKRYTPNKNYKGSKNYWSDSHRGNKKSHHTKHYNYNKSNHWNSNWEHYRWNHNSWNDYYHGYHFNSYVNHKHYYHHNHYGHVIRHFDYRPQVFVHNHHNYYSYNGHFFRYNRGVGYVLVDVPFGFSFEYLPHDYDRVNINGYAYYRVGNLFFEWANYGFRLVHYPERYYASNDNYCNNGYQFNDDYY